MTLPYIVNVALILAACLAFYKVLLRRETFYKVNRFLLIGCLAISFTLPLLQVPQKFSLRRPESEQAMGNEHSDSYRKSKKNQNQTATTQYQTNNLPTTISGRPETSAQPPTSNVQPLQRSPYGPTAFSFEQLVGWLFGVYWFGVFVFAGSFLFLFVLLLYRARRNPVVVDGKYRIVEVSGNKAPCSFGNTIFINSSAYDWETYNQILLHEKIHIRQKHTVDIILAELVLIFQWFNPFAWIYRREIENNLEFLTDDEIMQHNQVDKRSYQLSLLRVTAPHVPLSLTSNYNQSILKQRITMMNSKRSNLQTTWKYFFLLPVLAFLACLLNEPVAISQTSKPKSGKNAKNEQNIQAEPNVRTEPQVQSNINVQSDIKVQSNINMPNVQNVQITQNLQTLQNLQTVQNVQTAQDISIGNIETEGSWFATIKGEKISIQFKRDEDKENENNFNGNTFKLSEFSPTPKEGVTSFKLTRDAGTMEFTGKFVRKDSFGEGNTGMGQYKFIANKSYVDYMNGELKENLDDEDQLAFFFVDIKKSFLPMLKGEGYSNIEKEELIPVAALGIDQAYIRSIKNAGFNDVSLEDLVPLKAMKVDAAYIKEIRDAGYKNIEADELVAFKAQGIDKAYINKMKQQKGKDGGGMVDADDLVGLKAMNVDEAYINSFKAVGYSNIPYEELVSFKAVGVTPEYIKSWQAQGFKNIEPEDFVGMKSQGVTPEYMKSFTSMGYKNVKPEDLVAFKALGITPEYIKSFEAAGYKNIDFDELPALKSLGITPEYIKSFEAIGYNNIDMDELPALKAQDITPEFIKSFEALGFTNIPLDDIVAVKAVGVTPEYIKDMKLKGFNYNSLNKYITLKSLD